MKHLNKQKLVGLALEATRPGGGDEPYRRRRAFELAHRAYRLLERGAETASRDRWSLLTRPENTGLKVVVEDLSGESQFAAAVAAAVIPYPVHGEAAVYAAMLDAVDLARAVSEALYRHWLQTQRDADPLPVPTKGNRLGAPLATGCTRRESCGNSDEF